MNSKLEDLPRMGMSIGLSLMKDIDFELYLKMLLFWYV